MSHGSPSGLWANSETWPFSEALRSPAATERAVLLASGLFDGAWYLQTNSDVAQSGRDPAEHFLADGWREARRPNPYFDPAWYFRDQPATAGAATNPVLHYISKGEAERRSPAPYFDV